MSLLTQTIPAYGVRLVGNLHVYKALFWRGKGLKLKKPNFSEEICEQWMRISARNSSRPWTTNQLIRLLAVFCNYSCLQFGMPKNLVNYSYI